MDTRERPIDIQINNKEIQLKKRILTLGIVFALLMALVIPVSVAMAADTGDTDVGGNLTIPPGVLSVKAPSGITLGDLYGEGDAIGGYDPIDDPYVGRGDVYCTHEFGYTLTLESDQAEGKLSLDGLGETLLTDALKVTPTLTKSFGAPVTNNALTDVAVTTTQVVVGYTAGPADSEQKANPIRLSVAQPKQVTGMSGEYSITLTFTVTANIS